MRTILFSFCAFLLFTSACRDLGTFSDQAPTQSRPLTSAEQVLVASDNTLGFKLFSAVNRLESGNSVFISPVSVSMALGMTLNGAKGSTREAMVKTLEMNGLSQAEINASYQSLIALLTGLDSKVTLQIANSIWYRPDLNVESAFKDVNRQYFNAEINSINFSDPSAVGTINGWVNLKTNGKITKIVPDPIPPEMVMYLINAIYFKGSWTYRFDSTRTRDDVFILLNGSRKPCRMMSQNVTVNYYSDAEVQVVDLPYGDSGFSMTILLPASTTGVEDLAGRMTQAQWGVWVGGMKKTQLDVFLPKFKLEYEKKLNDMLIDMGMSIAFSSSQADFTNIDRRGGLFISEVRHKTFVQVDESGTEAAGVTSVGVGRTSVGPEPTAIRIDHPFLFVIRENQSGTVLFIGKITEPTL